MTRTELETYIKVAKNPFEFSKFVWVVHPVLGRVRFDLYPFQKRVLYEFLSNRFTIVLKSRQMGLTELIALFVLWLAMYTPYQNIQMISLKDRVAKRLLRRIKFMYRNLPEYLQAKIVNGRKGDMGTDSEMLFENGSSIVSVPTTQDAVRSEPVSLLVMDEAAIMKYAETIWAAALPSLSTGGRAIVNSCVTGDTKIIGKDRTFEIKEVCPEKFGAMDTSHLNLEVLSHRGQWRKVLGSVNKGELETWEVEDRFGNTLKCTPHHKLLTPRGWKTVKQIIEKNLAIISYDAGLLKLVEPRETIKPPTEELKPVEGFPNYLVSSWGRLFIKKKDGTLENKEARFSRKSSSGGEYFSFSLWHKNKKKKISAHTLVAKTFIGDIPEGYVVDHINNNPKDNYVTNLEIVTIQENAKRAVAYSRGLSLGARIGSKFPNLELVGFIKEASSELGGDYGDFIWLADQCREELGVKVTPAYVRRVASQERVLSVRVSHLKLKRKYIDSIYDISVEGDESYITENGYVSHNTPFGMGNFFHGTWQEALLNSNGFKPLKINWDLHPERDITWYKTMRNALGAKRTAQEVDCDFLASGDTVFDLKDIKDLEESLVDYPPIEKRLGGNLLIFEKPLPGELCFIGADVSTGRAKDYSTFSIVNSFGSQKAAFKGRIPVNKLTDLLIQMGYEYNTAEIAVDGIGVGEAVTSGLQEKGYPNLYYTVQIIKETRNSEPTIRKVPGFYANSNTRQIIINELEQDIRENVIEIKNPFFIAEAYSFIYDDMNRPVAMSKGEYIGDGTETYTDDSIFAEAIVNHTRKRKSTSYEVVNPR